MTLYVLVIMLYTGQERMVLTTPMAWEVCEAKRETLTARNPALAYRCAKWIAP
jgi:hypothetical protein